MQQWTHGEDPLGRVEAVLFDLDGTLLEVDMKAFIPAYVSKLASHFDDVVDPAAFGKVMLASTMALLRERSGELSNEALFLSGIERHLGIAPELFRQRLDAFCANGLADLAALTSPLPSAPLILERCLARGLQVVIATNPVFPRAVVEARLAWAGLADFPYALVTSYENSRYCKPQREYFDDILSHLQLAPEACLMVGNDTEHDLSARQLGISTFLVDTWMINRGGGRFMSDFRGGHDTLFRFVGQLGASGGND